MSDHRKRSRSPDRDSRRDRHSHSSRSSRRSRSRSRSPHRDGRRSDRDGHSRHSTGSSSRDHKDRDYRDHRDRGYDRDRDYRDRDREDSKRSKKSASPPATSPSPSSSSSAAAVPPPPPPAPAVPSVPLPAQPAISPSPAQSNAALLQTMLMSNPAVALIARTNPHLIQHPIVQQCPLLLLNAFFMQNPAFYLSNPSFLNNPIFAAAKVPASITAPVMPSAASAAAAAAAAAAVPSPSPFSAMAPAPSMAAPAVPLPVAPVPIVSMAPAAPLPSLSSSSSSSSIPKSDSDVTMAEKPVEVSNAEDQSDKKPKREYADEEDFFADEGSDEEEEEEKEKEKEQQVIEEEPKEEKEDQLLKILLKKKQEDEEKRRVSSVFSASIVAKPSAAVTSSTKPKPVFSFTPRSNGSAVASSASSASKPKPMGIKFGAISSLKSVTKKEVSVKKESEETPATPAAAAMETQEFDDPLEAFDRSLQKDVEKIDPALARSLEKPAVITLDDLKKASSFEFVVQQGSNGDEDAVMQERESSAAAVSVVEGQTEEEQEEYLKQFKEAMRKQKEEEEEKLKSKKSKKKKGSKKVKAEGQEGAAGEEEEDKDDEMGARGGNEAEDEENEEEEDMDDFVDVKMDEDGREIAADEEESSSAFGAKKDLKKVDHSKIEYIPFRKSFYIAPKEIAKLSTEEVIALRQELDGIKVRGKNCPRPVRTWSQCGLSEKILDTLAKLGFTKPFPIQAQSLPCIMSGRDMIGCAKTGSGKTLAYILPMLRHIMDQPPLAIDDGPIGVIIAPTRELAVQIHSDAKKFTKSLGLRASCVYGGSAIAESIADLKRGAEIVICTPGRMIDILCANKGRVTNLRRVSYIVLDEADRMFDLGFGPQVQRILDNIRPDRQLVMFSATFPKTVESLARKVLKDNPVEIIVGGRSVVSSTIDQHVEVIATEQKRFLRLLQLLGEWYEKGHILVFVDRQDECDQLFADLFNAGYPCLSLHGGKDQIDRDATLNEFKTSKIGVAGSKTLMVSTSLAARGLDVKDLVLVVNYKAPSHYEDYVHRVGRTGRAGRSGTAYTFLGPEEDHLAPELVKAYEYAKKPVPEDLQKLAAEYYEKKRLGIAKGGYGGYGGKGFKFDEEEEKQKKAERKMRMKAMGVEGADEDEVEMETEKKLAAEAEEVQGPSLIPSASVDASSPVSAVSSSGAAAPSFDGLTPSSSGAPQDASSPMEPSSAIQDKIQALTAAGLPLPPELAAIAKAQAMARAMAISKRLVQQNTKEQQEIQQRLAGASTGPGGAVQLPSGRTALELEVNDYPNHARWKVMQKDFLSTVYDDYHANVTAKGIYCSSGQEPPAGERKIYLLIEADTATRAEAARKHIKKTLEEVTLKVAANLDRMGGSRY